MGKLPMMGVSIPNGWQTWQLSINSWIDCPSKHSCGLLTFLGNLEFKVVSLYSLAVSRVCMKCVSANWYLSLVSPPVTNCNGDSFPAALRSTKRGSLTLLMTSTWVKMDSQI